MAIERKEVGRIEYKGRVIRALYLGPDLLGEVDGVEMGNFYVDTEAVYRVAKRDIDKEEADKLKEERGKKKRGKK